MSRLTVLSLPYLSISTRLSTSELHQTKQTRSVSTLQTDQLATGRTRCTCIVSSMTQHPVDHTPYHTHARSCSFYTHAKSTFCSTRSTESDSIFRTVTLGPVSSSMLMFWRKLNCRCSWECCMAVAECNRVFSQHNVRERVALNYDQTPKLWWRQVNFLFHQKTYKQKIFFRQTQVMTF